MAVKELDENLTNNIAGGANFDKYSKKAKKTKKWHFRCTICGYEWNLELTGSPGDIHGCPQCGWWFESEEKNGQWEYECVKYSDPDA